MRKTHPENGKCPSCGRDIGDNPTCVYCCRVVGRGVGERVLILASLPVILIGVLLLCLGAAAETDVSPIAKPDARDNFKHIRFVGEVSNVRYMEAGYGRFGVLSIWVRDDSSKDASRSTIKIKAEGEVVRDLIRNDCLPGRGDIVDAEGTLYSGAGYRLLNLNSARMLAIRQGRTPYEKQGVSDLIGDPKAHEGKNIQLIDAVVVDAKSPKRFRIADADSNEQSILVYGARIGRIRKGDVVTVRGLFMFYSRGGYWEVMIRRKSSDMVIKGGK